MIAKRLSYYAFRDYYYVVGQKLNLAGHMDVLRQCSQLYQVRLSSQVPASPELRHSRLGTTYILRSPYKRSMPHIYFKCTLSPTVEPGFHLPTNSSLSTKAKHPEIAQKVADWLVTGGQDFIKGFKKNGEQIYTPAP
ncbi:hypothetical protein BGX38DRAFT_1268738 [Terfezia claveryi]|nr:hypothetical protein BGX38DRAFT_1268738 [Terfezia claveryi]